MRIGFFSDSYYPYISGVVRSIDLFSRDLRNLGHDVFIFAPDYPECDEEPYIFRFSSVPAPNAPGFRIAIPYRPNIREKVRELNLDIIHTHSPFLMGRLASGMARKLKIPLVFTYHTRYEDYVHYVPFARKTARRLTIRLTRDFCRRCDLVVTPTKPVQKMLVKDGVTSPISVIPTGVDLQKYKVGNPHWMRKRYRFLPQEQVLLYVGRLGEEKNLFFLLDAVKDLIHADNNLYLMLVGGGPDEEDFRRVIVDWDLEHRIIFTGMVTPQKVIDYYLGADLFVFPSLTETQGLVILEAMAAGTPVVAINREGPADVVTNGVEGFLVEPDKTEFKNAIKKILDNADLKAVMTEKSLEKASSFSSLAMAKRMAEAYTKILGQRYRPKGEQSHI